jgi:Calcineurin-like phosphoesterase
MIRIIGDVHGKYTDYYRLASDAEYSIQLGDFGFDGHWGNLKRSTLDPKKHRVLRGNHDTVNVSKHDLGDYGILELDGRKIFFFRGGLSIDRVYRVGEELTGGPKTWWSEEELNLIQMLDVIKFYKKVKPDIVISHVPAQPFVEYLDGKKSSSILQKFKFHYGFQENTILLGGHLYGIHQPKQWFSGHFHINANTKIGKTEFTSLDELNCIDI